MAEENKYSLPDKLYFRIGEVSDIVGVKPYVLRYWETEFTDVRPTKSKSGQRLYKKRDVELLLQIKELLYEERFTISGAKQRMKEIGRISGAVQMPLLEPEAAGVTPSKGFVKKEEAVQTNKKFLQKMKSDLLWCLNELRLE